MAHESYGSIKTKIINLASENAGFRNALIANPKKAIKDKFPEVPEIPADLNICVHVENANTTHIVIIPTDAGVGGY